MASFYFPSTCPFCDAEIDGPEDFKDALSVKEFHISGLCQKCQNETFDPIFAEKDFEENPYG